MKSSSKCFLALWLVCTMSAGSFAQGVHVTLRANPSPKQYDVYSDVVADGNYAYLASDGSAYGVLIYDISNPDVPKLVAHYAPSTSQNMQGVQVSHGIGYFSANNGGGVHIVNLSDPTHPTLITRITSAIGGFDNVHDLTYDGNGHLYVPDYCNSDSVQVWNVSTPASPRLQMTLQGTDSLCVHDVTFKNNRLYMSGWSGTIDIWDVTNIDTQLPTRLGSFTCGVHSQDVSVTDDGNYLFCPREAHRPVQPGPGDVRVFNISDPAHVTMVADLTEQSLGIRASSPSTSKIMGNLLFVAWYQNGVAIFDITDPTHPVFVGNYDTWPGAVLPNGDGNWGVWPYLGLDKLIISDRTTGLYVLNATTISPQAAVFALWSTPATTTGSKTTTGTVYLVGKSPTTTGETVNVTSSSPAADSTPVFIPAGATSAKFTENTHSVVSQTTANLTASDGTYSAPTSLTLLPPQPSAVRFSPTAVYSGTVTGTVLMTAPAAANIPVTLALVSGSSAVSSAPTSATVTAGSSSASWTLNVHSLSASTSVSMSAAANGVKKTGGFTVLADGPSAVSFSPSSVTGGSATTGTINFFAPLNASTTITLTAVSGGSAVSIPATATAAAGVSQVTFTAQTNSVSSATTVKISASANGVTAAGSFTVQ